jgi:2'-5' RNA ligase
MRQAWKMPKAPKAALLSMKGADNMDETNKIQEAMKEIDRQLERPTVPIASTPPATLQRNETESATLLSWLKRFNDRQEEIDRKLSCILDFLGATEK